MNRIASTLVVLASLTLAVSAQRDPAPATKAGIQWFGTWETGLAEAMVRTGPSVSIPGPSRRRAS